MFDAEQFCDTGLHGSLPLEIQVCGLQTALRRDLQKLSLHYGENFTMKRGFSIFGDIYQKGTCPGAAHSV
jgi:hypothetical protein